ncbi:MAG TPA: MFS transporter [Steroidobacteraceae bacterium]|jgi:predicted MFS family arabinose efflux permease|nr:MFS transporter [Steroidobacteraceae bacterium]
MGSGIEILEKAKERAVSVAGGSARLQIIAVLAAILAVESSDLGTVSAISGELKSAFHLGNTDVGLLLAVVSFVSAAATLPMGALVDRFSRRTLLMIVVASWVIAEAVSGFTNSFSFLLVTRAAIGALTAVAWPCVASLTGDFFPARDRASIYGLIIAGELLGMGIGFFISGEASTLLNWHWSFYAMAVPAVALVWVIWRFLPEPARGSQSWITEGEEDPNAASRPASRHSNGREAKKQKTRESSKSDSSSPQESVRRARVPPREELILREDPTRWSLWQVMGYLLRLPTYGLLIGASALAYYFLSGARAFAMIYITQHYHITRSVVSPLVLVVGIGALAGTVAGGRLSQRLLCKGKADARIVVAAVALALSVPILGVAIWTSSALLGISLLAIGAGVLSAAVAPIDAARLDIVHPRMWGRGEAGRMALRSTFEGGAPLLFGALSEWLGGGQRGLMWTFLIMLLPMLLASLLGVTARKTYLRDVATAAASSRADKS